MKPDIIRDFQMDWLMKLDMIEISRWIGWDIIRDFQMDWELVLIWDDRSRGRSRKKQWSKVKSIMKLAAAIKH